MRFYQELTLIKTPEISPYFIWERLYMQVHLAFVEQQNSDQSVNFGVSFPEYFFGNNNGKTRASLGGKLRVFARTEAELQTLNLSHWLERLSDYVHIKSICAVPEGVAQHVLVKRYRANVNMERLTRRFMRRESQRAGREVCFEEARILQNQRYAEKQGIDLLIAAKHYEQPVVQDYPFIRMKSLSGEREFSLLINQQFVEQPQQGSFSTYGLSSQSTVPHW